MTVTGNVSLIVTVTVSVAVAVVVAVAVAVAVRCPGIGDVSVKGGLV